MPVCWRAQEDLAGFCSESQVSEIMSQWCTPGADAQMGSVARWWGHCHPTPPSLLLWHPHPCSANCPVLLLPGSQTEIWTSLPCSVSLLLLCHLHPWGSPAKSAARGKSSICWAAGRAGRRAPPVPGHPLLAALSRWEYHPPPARPTSEIFHLG